MKEIKVAKARTVNWILANFRSKSFFLFLFEVGIESVAETNVEEVQSRPGRLKIWRSVPQDYNDKLDEKA